MEMVIKMRNEYLAAQADLREAGKALRLAKGHFADAMETMEKVEHCYKVAIKEQKAAVA